jgi:hypothetical protein
LSFRVNCEKLARKLADEKAAKANKKWSISGVRKETITDVVEKPFHTYHLKNEKKRNSFFRERRILSLPVEQLFA